MKGKKYHNIPTEINGIRFASRKEARCYASFKLLESAGAISNLQVQVPFSIEVNGVFICKYIADMVYKENGKTIVVDVKGGNATKTRLYLLKKKLMKAVHNIEITEI